MEEPTRFAVTDSIYPDFALDWAKRIGANLNSILPLHGGINNYVFSCGSGLENSKRFVIKGYAPKFGVTDRMTAEVEFLQYAKQVASIFVPELLEIDYERRCIVLEYVDDANFDQRSSPTQQEVMQAANFFRQLNADKVLAREFIHQQAAEGFLGLSEHINNIRQRLNLIGTEHLSPQIKAKANILIQEIISEFNSLEIKTKKLIDRGQVQDFINIDECCVSPSDFGFHNAIRFGGGVKFIDFEFAGWDDPAKTLLDFLLQPRIPVASSLIEVFSEACIEIGGEKLVERVMILGPILRVKWLCIMLSVLRPDRLQQIAQVTNGLINIDLIDMKLEEARAYIDKEFSFGLH